MVGEGDGGGGEDDAIAVGVVDKWGIFEDGSLQPDNINKVIAKVMEATIFVMTAMIELK